MALKPGTRLGPYEIAAQVGEGGMGQVYRATDVTLGRSVAIKVLPEAFAADPDRLARFEREARTLASLNHPSIAAIYGFETYGDVRALVMEFVEGDDLSERIKRGAIPLADALPIARQLAEALEAAHELGIVHRDLKPANIKVRPDGTVKVLDFGLAKALDPASASAAEAMNAPTLTSPAMTRAGMILGTAAYMAPEQARGRTVDRRADIWAFGVVVFEMLSGRRVFGGDDVTDTIVSVVSKEPDWAALPSIPTALRRLLTRALKKDPKARLRDIGDARVEIEELIAGTADSVADAALPVTRRSGWSALTWTFAVATVALAATSVLLWAPWRVDPREGIADWTFSRKTFAQQAIFNARYARDGQTILFSAALSGNAPALFEARTDSLAPRPFGPPRTHLLSISKSGELAVLTNATYINHRLFRGTLARMTTDGAPRALAEDVRDADWLADGSDLAVVREVSGGDQLEFPAGRVVHRTNGYLSDPRVSPDGTRVAFMEHPIKFDDRGWVKVVDRAGVVTTLTREYGEEEGVAWSGDGQRVLYATTQVVSVLAAGGVAPTVLTNSAGPLRLFDAAADGRLIVIRDDSRTAVVARGAGQDMERVMSPRTGEWGGTLSPDGRFAAFTQGGAPDYHVLMRSTDGSPAAELGPGDSWAFSPDGRWVAANLPSTGRCVAYPTGAGTKVLIEQGPLQSCTSAFWAPGGKHVILIGKETGRPDRAYIADFPGGTPRALLPESLQPRGIQSGSACLLAVDAAGAWHRLDITGRTTAVKGLGRRDEVFGCSSDGSAAFAGDNATIPAEVFRVDLTNGQRRKITDVAPSDRAGLLNVYVTVYRESGQYVYWYVRGVSTLYVATPRK